jgi:hypothetical protein
MLHKELASSLLQFSWVAHEDVNGHGLSKFTHWGWQQTSTSFFKALPKKASSFSSIGAMFLETQLIRNYHDVQCPDYERQFFCMFFVVYYCTLHH